MRFDRALLQTFPLPASACHRAAGVVLLCLGLTACGGGALVDEDERTRGRSSDEVTTDTGFVVDTDVEGVEDPKQVWWDHRTELLGLKSWTAIGKLSIRSEDDAWVAALNWRQDGDAYRIRLGGPLGQGGLELVGDASSVTLKTADNKTYTADDPEQLLYETVGWRIPLSGLRYWILGRTEPRVRVDSIQINKAGRVLMVEQSGWQVRYLRYNDFERLVLPTKAALETEHLSAKVLVTRWTLDG